MQSQTAEEAPGGSGSVQLATENYIPGGDKNQHQFGWTSFKALLPQAAQRTRSQVRVSEPGVSRTKASRRTKRDLADIYLLQRGSR